MLTNELLAQFDLPKEAAEHFSRTPITARDLGDGVSVMDGHDRGIAFKFDVITVYNKIKSELSRIECFDEIEVIRWYKSRKAQPLARVTELPAELLEFNRDGEPVSGKYLEAYLRFKSGKKAPGMPLDKWGVLSQAECATLNSYNVFTVEQFAEWPESKLNGRFPIEYFDAHRRAKQYTASKDTAAAAEVTANELVKLNQENVKLKDRLEQLEKMLSGDSDDAMPIAAKRGRGRPRKTVEEN